MLTRPQTASLQIEQTHWAEGRRYVVGLDEAGRGTWAGPVVAGAVCLPSDRHDLTQSLAGVRDSKQMTARQRTRLLESIQRVALSHATGFASSAEIDALGIVPATRLAMRRALEKLAVQPDYLLLDSIKWDDPQHIPFQSIIRGDSLSLSIAAASVLAKVWRDEHMYRLDEIYPAYGFHQHKGYGTARHLAALRTHGPCPEHRMSFAPIRHLALRQPVLLSDSAS